MCLFTRQICPIKARQDIICYKVVKRYKHRTGTEKYITPCQKMGIMLYRIIKPEGPKMIRKKQTYSVIEGGYIHCCSTIEDAKRWINRNACTFHNSKALKRPTKWAIIKCVVHKGTLYYRSFDKTELCAEEIFTRNIVLQG